MKFDSIRRFFRSPILGDIADREITAKFVNMIVSILLVVVLFLLGYRLLQGESFFTISVLLLSSLAVMEVIILLAVRRGYIIQAAIAYILSSWAAITVQAWAAGGVRDVAVMAYILIILIASVVTNWYVVAIVTVLSIASIWTMAIYEANQILVPHVDTSFNIARDLTFIFIPVGALIFVLVNTLRESLEKTRKELIERLRAEQTLQEGEYRFRKIFDVSPVAIVITTLSEGRLINANDAYWKMSGHDPKTALGRTTTELREGYSPGARQEFVDLLVEKKSIHDPEYDFVNDAGEHRSTMAFYELISLNDQPAILSMFYDMTEQRSAQQALRASEEKYRNYIEQSIEGIWYVVFDQPVSTDLPAEEQARQMMDYGRISECNDAFARMYGLSSRNELVGTLWISGASENVRVNISQAIMQFVNSGYRYSNRETQEEKVGGEIVYFLSSSVGVVRDGFLIGAWGTQLDITSLKSAEKALRYSELRTRALLEAVPDMIFEINRSGVFLQFIPSATMSPLMPPEKFLGRNIAEVMPPFVAEQTMLAVNYVLATSEPRTFEYQLPDMAPDRYFEARVASVDENTFLAIVRDISIHKWNEAERENLITELAAKNAELERFTYTVSHDLKSPLITIKGFLGFLKEDAAAGNATRMQSDIQRIGDAAGRMHDLLNDLLELSRVGRLMNPPEDIHFEELVREALEVVHGSISQNNISVHVDDHLPIVRGDRMRLLEVMQNLIDNASKFMGAQPAPRIEIGVKGEIDGLSLFYVRDNGIGIPPEYKDNIFGLFNKLDARTEGTGVGLALVKRIIEFHGGRIWVESEQEKGATFFFTLPQSDHQN